MESLIGQDNGLKSPITERTTVLQDELNNTWIEFQDRPLVYPLFGIEPKPPRILITPAGMELLHTYNLSPFQVCSRTSKISFLQGSEGAMYEVYPNRHHKDQPIAAEKRFHQGEVKILAWDIARLLLNLEPEFKTQRLHLVPILGATQKSLYTKYIPGMKLSVFLARMRNHELADAFTHDLTILKHSVDTKIKLYAQDHDLELIEDDFYFNSSYADYRFGIRCDIDTPSPLAADIIIPSTTLQSVQRHIATNDIEKVYKTVRKDMVFVDPVYTEAIPYDSV